MIWNKQEQQIVDTAMRNIGQYGADRVITSSRGTSVPYSYAVDEFKIDVEMVFIRNDGWTLGCHRTHQSVAYGLWKEEWIAILIKPEDAPRRIEDALKIDVGTILPPMKSFPPKRVRRPRPGGVKGVWSYVGKEGTEEEPEEDVRTKDAEV